MKKTYTVVLIVDKRLCDGTEDLNVYVAHGIKADGVTNAYQAAAEEAHKSYLYEGVSYAKLRDFTLCVVFEGNHRPVAFPWSIP